MSEIINNKETIKELKSEARKLGLTFREYIWPGTGEKYYRFTKRRDSTKIIVSVRTLGIALEWVYSDCLSSLVANLKNNGQF